ncbi:Beta-ketoacyl-acyl-carrier-protein synthase I [Serratia ficaria]|uniref:SDR family NAD(P)-dependent oxidoreductase n=1 Tax=Serratia ficaria TaxID=61651 RepID=UPI0021833E3F|nr:SDR family NAD(P)-dependent oxidoreductase [Serratia ficaria]CAI2536326.1 Beta-ketoacyl-acyl-carrier-protein synthase I [Serratia ficaria]
MLSGRTDAAARGAAQRLAAHLRAHPEVALQDTAWSLATTRSHHEHRLALVADGREAAAGLLEQLACGEQPGGTRGGVSTVATRAWLFTGQGSQRCGMGQELWAQWPAFRQGFDAACEALDRELGGDLKAVMWGDDERQLAETGWTQPALFALQAGLAALWRSWGIQPDYVAGHSLGELSAAYAAGVFTLEEAARLVAARGRLMQALPSGGSMAALNLPETEVRRLTAGLTVSLAAVNGPSSVVISGEAGVVREAADRCVAAGGRATELAVSHAFHSGLMAPMLAAFRDVAEGVNYQRPSVAVVSNVSGKLADDALCTAEYWVEHVMETVRFADGIATLAENGVNEFIELGPQGTLLGMAAECLEDGAAAVQLVASLQRKRGETQAVLEGLGALHVRGAALNWPGVFSGGERRVALPLYAWQRERYWVEASPQMLSGEDSGHPLLGSRISLAGDSTVFESLITPHTHGWLYDHVFGGVSIMPGTGWAEIIWAAGHHYFKETHTEVSSLVIRSPLVMAPDGFKVQVHIKDRGEFYEAFAYSLTQGHHDQAHWQLHASAEIHAGVKTPQLARAALHTALGEYSAVNTDEAYAGFTLLGVEYRNGFRGVSHVSSNGRYTLAELLLPEEATGSGYGGHPVLLDSAIQALWAKDSAAIFQRSKTETNHFSDVYLLFSIDSYVVWQADARRAKVAIALRETEQNDNGIIADMVFYDENDKVVMEITGLRERLISYDTLKSGAAENAAVYRTRWKEAQPAHVTALTGSYLVVAQKNDDLGENTAALLRARGLSCELVDFTQLASAPQVDNIVCCFASPAAGHETSWTPLSHALTVLKHLVQHQADVRLWWVTRDAVSENYDTLRDSAQYALWGAGRTLMFEHPEYQCTLIDLPVNMGADALIPAITRDNPEQEIRLTAAGEYVARLEQVKESSEGTVLKPSGTILITGGLGGVARQIGLKLAQAGAAHLMLTGRRGLDTPDAAQIVAELEAAGARVTVVPADISDAKAVAGLLEQIPPALPLQGVIHAAGVLNDGILHEQSDVQLNQVFDAKVQGAIHLDRMTREHDLDFFVLFSSIAGTLGSAGQGIYAAANACLDAIAANRRTLGLAGQSLAWGLWTDEASNTLGLAAGLDSAHLARLQKTGVGSVTPALGGKLFARLLGNREANLLLAPLDLPQLKASFGETIPSLWQELLRAAALPKPNASGLSLTKELASLPESAYMERIVDVVRSAIMEVLSINSNGANGININRPLSELGLDSLTAVELRNALRKTTGKTLPTTLAFDYPTISDIALYILRLFTVEMTAAQEDVHEIAPLPATHAETAALSEEEVDDELAKYINEFLN